MFRIDGSRVFVLEDEEPDEPIAELVSDFDAVAFKDQDAWHLVKISTLRDL
jgi:hypothetical protein